MDEIEDVCGIPGTPDTPAENQCRIRAVVCLTQLLPQTIGSYSGFLKFGR
jgi:hypothetical protein